MGVNVTRPHDGITLNKGYLEQILLNDSGEPMLFKDEQAAKDWLIANGVEQEHLDIFSFPDAVMEGGLFKLLTPEEEQDSRNWAIENYVPGQPINELWHPVTREACNHLNQLFERGIRPLPQAVIDKFFEDATHQTEAVVGLYKYCFPNNWDDIKQLNHFPSVSRTTYRYIHEKAIRFDKEHHPEVFSGGMWMNNGFTINENMPDWEVDNSTADPEMK